METALDTPRKPYALYAITRHALDHVARLAAALPGADVYVPEELRAAAANCALPNVVPMGTSLTASFLAYDCHVFMLGVGVVVRMIAPLLADAQLDPAVICVDDAARFSICVLPGHLGRGNAFAERVARILGAQAVIGSTPDAPGTLPLDTLGRELGFVLDDPDRNLTRGCAALVNARPVALIQEAGEPEFWPRDQPLPRGVQYFHALDAVDPAAFDVLLIVSDRLLARTHPQHFARAVVYRPKSLILGIGCDRSAPSELVSRGVRALLDQAGLDVRSVRAIATIDVKADEVALNQLSEELGVPLVTFTAEELRAARGSERSLEPAQKPVSTAGISEPAALLGAGAETLLVPKQTYTEPSAGRTLTLAVARIPFAARPAVVADARGEHT